MVTVTPTLGIIIPIFNEAISLPGCLNALLPIAGQCPVVVADGGSTDGSIAIARQHPLAARMVIAQVNPFMPRTHGDTFIQLDQIDYLVDAAEPLGELPEEPLGEREKTISAYCSELIEDGSIVQFGFAGISRGLMDFLKDHRHLGLRHLRAVSAAAPSAQK